MEATVVCHDHIRKVHGLRAIPVAGQDRRGERLQVSSQPDVWQTAKKRHIHFAVDQLAERRSDLQVCLDPEALTNRGGDEPIERKHVGSQVACEDKRPSVVGGVAACPCRDRGTGAIHKSARTMGRPVATLERDAPGFELVVGRVEHTVSLFANLGEIGVLRRRGRIGAEGESSLMSRPRDGGRRAPALEMEILAIVYR